MNIGDLAACLVIVIVGTARNWLVTSRQLRQMGQALGRNVKDTELTSITTWMKMLEAERRDQGNKPIGPASSLIGDAPLMTDSDFFYSWMVIYLIFFFVLMAYEARSLLAYWVAFFLALGLTFMFEAIAKRIRRQR